MAARAEAAAAATPPVSMAQVTGGVIGAPMRVCVIADAGGGGACKRVHEQDHAQLAKCREQGARCRLPALNSHDRIPQDVAMKPQAVKRSNLPLAAGLLLFGTGMALFPLWYTKKAAPQVRLGSDGGPGPWVGKLPSKPHHALACAALQTVQPLTVL